MDVAWSLTIDSKFHGEGSLPLSHTPKIRCISERFGERDFSLDHAGAFKYITARHDSTSTNHIAYHCTLEIFWALNFHIHDRLKQLRCGLLEILSEATLCCGVEGFLGRVHLVEATVIQVNECSHDRVFRNRTFFEAITEPFFNRWDVLLWNSTTHDMLFEFEAIFAVGCDRS